MPTDLSILPDGLPIPQDDGRAKHLTDLTFPTITLSATNGRLIKIAPSQQLVVIYVYPLTGRPGLALPYDWDAIPGARGCTAETCNFQNFHQQFEQLGALVYGLSSQTPDYQSELKQRLQLPFDLLSDSERLLKKLLNLPTFFADGMELYCRLTLVVRNTKICKVFYPVFPPNQHAQEVLAWLERNV